MQIAKDASDGAYGFLHSWPKAMEPKHIRARTAALSMRQQDSTHKQTTMKHNTKPTHTIQPQLPVGGESKSEGLSPSSTPAAAMTGTTSTPPTAQTPKGVTLTSAATPASEPTLAQL